MEEKNGITDESKINFLIFEFMKTYIGVDMDQISEIREKDLCDEELRIFHLHEMVPNIKMRVTEHKPKILIVEYNGGRVGIVVNMPKEIASFSEISVKPLPLAIEIMQKNTPFWGVVIHKNKIVLLADVLKLIMDIEYE